MIFCPKKSQQKEEEEGAKEGKHDGTHKGGEGRKEGGGKCWSSGGRGKKSEKEESWHSRFLESAVVHCRRFTHTRAHKVELHFFVLFANTLYAQLENTFVEMKAPALRFHFPRRSSDNHFSSSSGCCPLPLHFPE